MKKILVLLTGGTIGSKVENGVIDVGENSVYLLTSLYEEMFGKEDFEVQVPLQILSENMTMDSLLVLLKTVRDVKTEEYAGVIIAHGSDTLSFTSAFMGLLFDHYEIPIVLVASNLPLSKPEGNGLANFAAAVSFIRGGAREGAYVIYRDHENCMKVYHALTICEADPVLDDYHDFTGEALGYMEDGRFLFFRKKEKQTGHPGGSDADRAASDSMETHRDTVPDSFDNSVLVIRPYPGMDYSFFTLEEEKKPAAVLHYLYHSATACVVGECTGFPAFAKRCREKGIPLYTASHKRTEGDLYASADQLLLEGAIPLLNQSVEAAYARLMLRFNGGEI